MNTTRQGAGHRVLVWLLVTAAAVLAAQSQQWTSAVTTATAVYAIAGPDRRSRP
ncbi:hypothetical protein [Streptomyces sp. NPDC058228]|uniref:hypothetical protein n=1 Tax=Streptomyces sp. NPDC058228 TaxID=3346390 RepID=UPI0036E66745